MTRARRSRAASVTSSPIHSACWPRPDRARRPISRTAIGAPEVLKSIRTHRFPEGCVTSSPTPPPRDRNSRAPLRTCCRPLGSANRPDRDHQAPQTPPRASSSCPDDGSSRVTFAWLNRCRRLAKDWEKSIASAQRMDSRRQHPTPHKAAAQGTVIKHRVSSRTLREVTPGQRTTTPTSVSQANKDLPHLDKLPRPSG